MGAGWKTGANMEGWKACGDPEIVIILGGFWEDILLLGDSLHLSFLSDSRAFTCFDRSSFCFFDIIKSVSKSAQFSTSMRRSFCISSCLRFISASLKFKSRLIFGDFPFLLRCPTLKTRSTVLELQIFQRLFQLHHFVQEYFSHAGFPLLVFI